jgi:type IV pilus assembly protein PilA
VTLARWWTEALLPAQVHINNQHFFTMTSLDSRLQLALINRKKNRNLLEKGFTLVELMIVIVIVGILSSVALPNFLSQSNKAKGTEAKTQAAALIKSAASLYSEGGLNIIALDLGDADANGVAQNTAGGVICTGLGGPVDDTTTFNYKCETTDDINGADATGSDPGLTVTATANGNDSGIENNVVEMNVNFTTGIVTTDRDTTSKMFGGNLADV